MIMNPPLMLQPVSREHQVESTVFKLGELKGMICTNLPGYFPFIFCQGNNYVFVLYNYDSNTMLAAPIKS